jgi:hypothetical protein
VKNDEMDVACSMHGREKKFIRNFGRKTLRVVTTRKPMCRCEDDIRMDFRETGWEVMDWIIRLVVGTICGLF